MSECNQGQSIAALREFNATNLLQVSYLAGNLHDAVMLYALTADDMLKKGLDPRDGRLFTKHARTIQFQGEQSCTYGVPRALSFFIFLLLCRPMGWFIQNCNRHPCGQLNLVVYAYSQHSARRFSLRSLFANRNCLFVKCGISKQWKLIRCQTMATHCSAFAQKPDKSPNLQCARL